MTDRAGQVWELDGGAIILVVASWRGRVHDVLILKGNDKGSRFNHHEGALSPGWSEGRLAWEEPDGDRRRIA